MPNLSSVPGSPQSSTSTVSVHSSWRPAGSPRPCRERGVLASRCRWAGSAGAADDTRPRMALMRTSGAHGRCTQVPGRRAALRHEAEGGLRGPAVRLGISAGTDRRSPSGEKTGRPRSGLRRSPSRRGRHSAEAWSARRARGSHGVKSASPTTSSPVPVGIIGTLSRPAGRVPPVALGIDRAGMAQSGSTVNPYARRPRCCSGGSPRLSSEHRETGCKADRVTGPVIRSLCRSSDYVVVEQAEAALTKSAVGDAVVVDRRHGC